MTIKTVAAKVTEVIVENDYDMGFVIKKDEDGDLVFTMDEGDVQGFVQYEDLIEFRDNLNSLIEGMIQ